MKQWNEMHQRHRKEQQNHQKRMRELAQQQGLKDWQQGKLGMETLKAVTDGINPEYALDDKKYGRQWQVVGDMDGYRTKVIEAILKIEEEN